LSQQSSGLRFDIYERVQLPADAVPVKEFHGLELSPDIRVEVRGDQAVLQGHLALTGTYAGIGDSGGEDEKLEHRIPVEITLPLYRVPDVENLRIGIENFDVDLLAPRTLNVTGVLLLEGIRWSAPAEEAAVRREEEVVFTHRAAEPEGGAEGAAAAGASGSAAETAAEAIPEAAPDLPADFAAANAAEEADAAAQTAAVNAAEAALAGAEPPAAEEAREAPPEPAAAAAAEREEAAEEGAEDGTGGNEPAADAADAPQAASEAAAEEIKIQFAGKPAAADAPPLGAAEILSMTSGASAAAASAAVRDPNPDAEKEPAPAAAEPESRDRVEWKNLFLSPDEAPAFRKLRMVIAQKEDTIETIAERYRKSARELMLHNRLKEPYLQEGQVIYIP